MILRFVFLKLADRYANTEGRREVVERTLQELPTVPGVRSVTVGVPADESSLASWDISICLRFDRIEDVEAYQLHPIHREYVECCLQPRLEVKKAWNFEATSSPT